MPNIPPRLQQAAQSFTGLDANGALRSVTGLDRDANGISYELFGGPIQAHLAELIALLGGGLNGTGLETTTKTIGTDGYNPNVTGETWSRWEPDSGTAGTPLILLPYTSSTTYDDPNWDVDLHLYASYGFTVIATTAFAYGNQNSQAIVDSSITWAGTTFGVDTTRVCLIGDSAGAATVMNWMWRNPANPNVRAAALRIPVCDVEALHARNPFGVATTINNAYLAEYATLEEGFAAHDPIRHTADVIPIIDKLRLIYGLNDGIVIPGEVKPFIDATGIHSTAVPNLNHSLANFPSTLATQILGFFISKVGLNS